MDPEQKFGNNLFKKTTYAHTNHARKQSTGISFKNSPFFKKQRLFFVDFRKKIIFFDRKKMELLVTKNNS